LTLLGGRPPPSFVPPEIGLGRRARLGEQRAGEDAPAPGRASRHPGQARDAMVGRRARAERYHESLADPYGVKPRHVHHPPQAGAVHPPPLVPLRVRSEEHTSELQSPYDLVCRLLLEKKKQKQNRTHRTPD